MTRAEQKKATGWVGSKLPAGSPVEELQLVVEALNGKWLYSVETDDQKYDHQQMLKETPPMLRDLVASWQESGSEQFPREWPRRWEAVHRFWRSRPLELALNPSGPGMVHLFIDYPGATPREEALRFFILLLINPERDKLAGPCPRCDSYYVKKRASQKVYCSRNCGNSETALISTRARRQKEHADKLRRAFAAAQEWSGAHTTLTWKQWICRKESDITHKFLTRAVNKGQLEPPVHH